MDTLLYERQSDGIALLTINRPHAHNALDLATMRRFADTIASVTADDARVLIVMGAGERAFCSGGDLADLHQHTSAAEGEAMVTLMGDALLAMERLPVPVIGAINGYALGGGSEIALACDLRVVDEAVQLGAVHVRRGLIPGWGGGQRLLRLVGYARAMDILLTGRTLHAPELRALGLVSAIAPAGQALARARELAATIAGEDKAAVRAVKALLQAGLRTPYDEALKAERALFPDLWTGEAHAESVRRFMLKRGAS